MSPIRIFNRSATSQFRNQWRNPADIFTILLLVGPDVIQQALAQQSGGIVTPVAFSFGWVAYAFNALVSTFGNGRILPGAEMNAQLVVAKSGSVRTNQAWIISRLLRDFEQRMSEETYETDKSAPKYEALRISVFEIDQQVDPGTMTHDWKWYSGFAVILLQLVVSCIPVILYSNWFVVTITAAGTMLALIQGTFPQWKKEKWASTKTGGSTVSISQGNGSRHVMTILGRDHTPSEQLKNYKGLDLEILAGGSKRFRPAKHSTQLALLLTILWTALLISVAGLQEDSWFLLAAGIIGMMHSIFVAGATRSPGVYGIHLKPVEAITARKVAMVLHEAEEKYPTVGSSLIPVFFPGRMYVNKEEIEFWDAAAERRGLKGAEELPVAVKPTIE